MRESESQLAPYAAHSALSVGRQHEEPPPRTRTQFQRDRDRIIHCTAFRRLEYKTQVFVNHEGDLFRTRLTHTLEVAQIARSVARCLRVNEDLVEAISLAHDLGHTPFGHTGQDALNECMAPHGGFEHNLQSLRVVDVLEERYGAFDGLNLTFETREGILKHCSRKNAQVLGDVARRFLIGGQASIEAQIANLADEIAYNNHDIDDGLRSGLLSVDQLREVPLFAEQYRRVGDDYPTIAGRRAIHETIRRIIDVLVSDLIAQSQANIDQACPADLTAVREAPPLVAFSAPVRATANELKRFLFHHLYRHPEVMRVARQAAQVVTELFQAFLEDPARLPAEHSERTAHIGPRAVADYIAGMTDRYAIREHRRLFPAANVRL
jgi:dGTPase